jgi:hypothetical protein
VATKITKIEIEIDDKVIELNVKQAKELKSILADMFSEPTITSVPYPVYIDRPWRWWDTTWSNTSNTVYLCAH